MDTPESVAVEITNDAIVTGFGTLHSFSGGLAGRGTSSNVQWRKGTEREREALVPVPTHIDQSIRRIELSLKKARS
jgi:hypothetical protein